MDNTPSVIPFIEVEGKFVRVCSVCGKPKEKPQFYPDEVGKFDGGDGWSKDCRSCRLKQSEIDRAEERVKHDKEARDKALDALQEATKNLKRRNGWLMESEARLAKLKEEK